MDNEEKIKKFWESRSERNDFLWKDLSELNSQLTSKYLAPNFDVLDLGCGDGKSNQNLNFASLTLVDYVQPKNLVLSANSKFVKEDIRKYRTTQRFDLITLYGVANSFSEKEIAKIYHACYGLLKENGTLLVKHQCGKESDVFVDKFSEELQCDYCAYYLSCDSTRRLLRQSGFDVEIIDPYPESMNKWSDTVFKAFICKKTSVISYRDYFPKEYPDQVQVDWFAMHERRKKSKRSREIKFEILKMLKEKMDSHDIPFYLMYGSLLGVVRENDFIKWDEDVDVGVLGRFQNRLAAIIDHLHPLQLLRIGDYYFSLMYKDEFVDVYTFTEEDEKYSYCGGLKRYFDEEKEVFDEPSAIQFKGLDLLTVKDPIQSLERWYGLDWQVEKEKESDWLRI